MRRVMYIVGSSSYILATCLAYVLMVGNVPDLDFWLYFTVISGPYLYIAYMGLWEMRGSKTVDEKEHVDRYMITVNCHACGSEYDTDVRYAQNSLCGDCLEQSVILASLTMGIEPDLDTFKEEEEMEVE